MNPADILGLVAGVLTTAAFIPQVVKTVKTGSTEDISLAMFSILNVGIILWIVYGFWVNALPVILANCATLVSTTIILFYKLRR